MIHYVCKYTPVELFKGFGEECAVLEEMPENFEDVRSDRPCQSVWIWKIRYPGRAGRKSRRAGHGKLLRFHAKSLRYCEEHREMQIPLHAGSAS